MDLRLEWISGVSNRLADALSRRPHAQELGVQVNVIDDFDPSVDFLKQVRSAYSLDPFLSNLIRNLKGGKADTQYSIQEDLLYFNKSCLVIPESMRLKIFKDFHDAPLAGHPAKHVTKELISCNFH